MNVSVILWLSAGYVASFFFLRGLLRGSVTGWEKWGLAVMLFVPFLGPLLYLFLREDVPPQDPYMQAPASRGVYTDRMIAMRSFYEEAFKSLEEKAADEEAGQTEPMYAEKDPDGRNGADGSKAKRVT